MIVKMKKVTLLCLAEDQNKTLNKLRDLGVVHLTHIQKPEGSDLDVITQALEKAETSLRILDALSESDITKVKETAGLDSETAISQIIELSEKNRILKESCNTLISEKKQVEPFGDFNPSLIKDLEKKNIFVKLYRATKKIPFQQPDNLLIVPLSENSSDAFLATVGQDNTPMDMLEQVNIDRPLSDIENDITSISNQINNNTAQITNLYSCYKMIAEHVTSLQADKTFLEAKNGMGMAADARIAYLQGFCPVNKIASLESQTAEYGWGLKIDDPSSDDSVPTLIKNPKWIKPIKALFEAIKILPGYRELDANIAFLIFFSIFFGILVGDAGYGAIFLVMTILARIKFKKAQSYPFWLLGILSVSTIIWGAITSNYFGTGLPLLDRFFKIEWLSSERNLFVFCFLVGAIHLSIAHIWRLIVNINSTRAIAQAGWIILTWCMYFAAKLLVLGEEAPAGLMAAVVTGVVLIITSITLRFKQEWESLTTLFFDVIGNFVDVVSYIRLYAVGMAGLAVAQAFNALALGSDGQIDGFLAGLGAALILFLGHALNMVLCLMSVLVHGVRLNTLEFSGHIGLEWGGFPYKPFKTENKNEDN